MVSSILGISSRFNCSTSRVSLEFCWLRRIARNRGLASLADISTLLRSSPVWYVDGTTRGLSQHDPTRSRLLTPLTYNVIRGPNKQQATEVRIKLVILHLPSSVPSLPSNRAPRISLRLPSQRWYTSSDKLADLIALAERLFKRNMVTRFLAASAQASWWVTTGTEAVYHRVEIIISPLCETYFGELRF